MGRLLMRGAMACVTLGLLWGCGPSYGEDAKVCAHVVKLYLGLPNVVGIVRASPGPGTGEVTLDYESANAENLPVKGSASCVLGTTEDGARGLLSAVVNGTPLAPDVIASINEKLR